MVAVQDSGMHPYNRCVLTAVVRPVCVCIGLQQGPYSPDVLQWMALVNNNPTRGARVVFLQILH